MTAEAPDPQSHFQSEGEAYARWRPSYPPALAAALAERAPDRVLAVDVGCGTGQLTVQLAEHFEQVAGLDVSASQIGAAPARENVRYHVGPAEDLSGLPERASLIVAAQAAHWFDLRRFYQSVRAVARPQAVVALVSYGVMKVDVALCERFDAFYWNELAEAWPPERRHVETGYAAFDFPFEEETPPQLSIVRAWPLEALLGYVETWSAVKRLRRDGGGARVDAFRADMAALWGDPGEPRDMVWPIAMRLGRV